MDFYLSKIEPHLVREVNNKTSDNVVHTKENVTVNKDGKQQDRPEEKEEHKKIYDFDEAMKIVEELNKQAHELHLDVYYDVSLENEVMMINIYELKTKKLIRICECSVAEKMLRSREKSMGGFLDAKG